MRKATWKKYWDSQKNQVFPDCFFYFFLIRNDYISFPTAAHAIEKEIQIYCDKIISQLS